MKRIAITIFMIAVFAVGHVKAQYDKKLPDITFEYNESQVSFMFEGAFSPYDYIKAEDSLNYLLQETYGIGCAHAYVEEALGLPYKVYVEISICDYNYTPQPKYFYIKCHLFHFTITQKGLVVQDAHISKSGSLAGGDATVIFNKQTDVGYYLYCNELLIEEIRYNAGGGGNPKSIPVTQEGIYTLKAYIPDFYSEEWPLPIGYGPVAIPGNVSFSFSDSPTPPGEAIDFTETENYILTRTMLNEAGSEYMDKVDYYDGLGRPKQTVMRSATPGLKDIVTLLEYDSFGRESNRYLPTPVTSGTGGYVSPSAVKTASNSFYGDSYAYEKPVYEPSPLNRIVEQYGAGSAWHTGEKRVTTSYHTNSSTGDLTCALYAVVSDHSLERKGLYDGNELFVTRTTGEDGHVLYTFTDKLGRTVLERVMDGTERNDTYYVYDDFGNLRYVLPPAASDVLTISTTWADTNATLTDYAYIYKYDERNRCTRKKLPGCDPVEMRYDKADRLIFTQDGNQRSKTEKEWTFYLYDTFGRPTVTGIWVSSIVPDVSGTAVKASYDAGGTILGGYTVNLTLPSTVKLMTVNYYDDYAFINTLTAAEKPKMSMVSQTEYGNAYPNNTTPNAKGLLTGTRTYRLDDPTKYSVSALYYDERGRVVQSHTSNHLDGYEDEYFAYTFTGKVKQRQHVHSKGTQTQTETYYYDYGTPATNPTERLLSVSHKLNSAPQVSLVEYSYDDVGRVKTKKLATETATHNYNVRSWLTQITGTKFNQTLAYNTAVNGVTPTKALYNGNISAMKWRAGDETTERGYKFSYDGLDRLTSATYGEGTNIASNLNRYNETVTAYDKMGNIKTLQRQGKLDSGWGMMDNLTYTYTGNKLTKVSDAATPTITYPGAFHFVDRANVDNEYTYDKNGNLTKDLNKNITSITYNALNLPSVITFSDGNTITYGYNAAGSKLSVAYKSGGTTVRTDYVGNKVYKNGVLSMILTEEGYATLSGTTPTYYYYLKDHQGNNRVVINQSGIVQQVNHYYAFGGLFGEGIQTSNQPYKYNGKELDRFQGVDMYDYGARHYDAALGRWFTVDPLSQKYYSISSYTYVANNPVKYIDPNGKWIESAWDAFSLVTGAKSFVDNIKAGNVIGAVVDGVGVLADATALVVPGVPGGAGAGIKALRTGDKIVDAVTTGNKVDNAADTGNAMQRLRKSAETGQEAHRQIQKDAKLADPKAKIEQNITLKDGQTVRKDVVKSDGTTMIIKPNTPSGQKSASKREILMQNNGYKTEKVFYDPKDPKYQPDSPTYIGPRKKN